MFCDLLKFSFYIARPSVVSSETSVAAGESNCHIIVGKFLYAHCVIT